MDNLLSSTRVEEIYTDCLAKHYEPSAEPVFAIQMIAGFNQSRLNGHRAEIEAMLLQLPVQFQDKNGASFLDADTDINGTQWTGVHQTVEKLILLGLAIGKVAFTVPREYWSVLPKKAPFFTVNSVTEG